MLVKRLRCQILSVRVLDIAAKSIASVYDCLYVALAERHICRRRLVVRRCRWLSQVEPNVPLMDRRSPELAHGLADLFHLLL